MFLRFFDDGLAQASFLVACDRTREAAVVDPRRDIDVYVAAAREHGLTLALAIDTHVHADFVSGSRELTGIGVRALAGPTARLRFPAREVGDRDTLSLGDTALTFLHTPGHTPEHICVLVREPGAPDRLLTGDTLFVGAVGRPDLLGAEQAGGLASDLYRSLYQVLLTLPDDTEVHPGHGAGSLCGAGIGTDPQSTIGRERRSNPMLRYDSEREFVAAVLGDLPETPAYFARMKRINQQGPPLLGLDSPVAPPPVLTAEEAARAVAAGAVVLDVRSSEAFGATHMHGAVHIAFSNRVGYWAGWVIEPGARLIIVTDDDRQAVQVRRQLLRVGLDTIVGVLPPPIEAWTSAGIPLSAIDQISVQDLQRRLGRGDRLTVVDVRTLREWVAGHIDGARHLPVGEIPARAGELPHGAPVAVICEGGFRSSLAASLLERSGAAAIMNVTGGMAAYRTLELTR